MVVTFPLGGDTGADERSGSSLARTELVGFFLFEFFGLGELQCSNKLNFAHNFNSLFSIHNKLITLYIARITYFSIVYKIPKIQMLLFLLISLATILANTQIAFLDDF